MGSTIFSLWMMLLYSIEQVEHINKLTSSSVAPCWTSFLELKIQITTSTNTSWKFLLVSKLSINYVLLKSLCNHHTIALSISEKGVLLVLLLGHRTKGWERQIYYCQRKSICLCLGFRKCIAKMYSGYSAVHSSFPVTPIAIRYINIAKLICGLNTAVSSHQWYSSLASQSLPVPKSLHMTLMCLYQVL